jgi:hypothetical protein
LKADARSDEGGRLAMSLITPKLFTEGWLGLHSPQETIRKSGLWNTKGTVNKVVEK